MIRLVRLFGTSVGQKLVVAGTGSILLLFVLAHMLGNMAVFQGLDSINAYAAWLQGHPLVWFMRFGLLAVFVIHVGTTIRLAIANNGARETAYQRRTERNGNFTSRYMVLTGLLLFSFVIYHLAHFTFGFIQPENYGLLDVDGRRDVYTMVVRDFQNPLIAGSYVLSMFLLGVHLMHGAASIFQTFGLNHESYDVMVRYGSFLLVVLIVIGTCSVPILIATGFVALPGGN